jgi:hypothetical protein
MSVGIMRLFSQSLCSAFQHGKVRLLVSATLIIFSSSLFSMPQTLKNGLLEFEYERNRYLATLLLLDDKDRNEKPVLYASALQAFDMPLTLERFNLESHVEQANLAEKDKFRLALLHIEQGDCVTGLKYLKGKALSLDASSQQKRAYYRAKCFVELGHDELAAQALSRALSGEWAAHAYYNLAMEYLATSKNKKRALVALKVARELNVKNGGSAVELTNRINLNAGKVYLDSGKPELANDFFNEIPLSSRYVTEGLYLHGFAKLYQNDFRAAAQSWQANLKHALISPGVAESLLALPLSYDQSGYQTQALEAYIDASKRFKKELKTLTDIKNLIKKYSAREVLIEDSDRAELQWFLNKTGAKNTQRVAYYDFVLQDEQVYRNIKLVQELSSLDAGLGYWLDQLGVHEKAVKARQKTLNGFPKAIKKSKLETRLSQSQIRFETLSKTLAQLKGSEAERILAGLSSRLEILKAKSSASNASGKGLGKELSEQRSEMSRLKKSVSTAQKRSKATLRKLDKRLSELCIERLNSLEARIVGHKEAAELGLVTILERVARSRTKRTNLLNGKSE